MSTLGLRDRIREETAAIDREATNVGQTIGDLPVEPTDHQRWMFAAALAGGTEWI